MTAAPQRRRSGMRRRRCTTTRRAVFAALLLAAGGAAPAAEIYTCVDASGRRLTSDRPIAECRSREQRQLNADGSVKRTVPPTMTADERAEAEAAERRRVAEQTARQDAVRRDRNLLIRFPNEAAHRRARDAALEDLRRSVQQSQQRITVLMRERKPLLDEAEFYAGRMLPAKLRQALDANDAGLAAQRTLVQNQSAEATRINALFDAELDRLKRLWAGASPGSLGAFAPPVAASP